MFKLKNLLPKLLSCALIVCLTITAFSQTYEQSEASATFLPQSEITEVTASVDTNIEDYLSSEVVSSLPSGVSDDADISVIIEMNVDSVLDAYNNSNSTLSVSDYSNTATGRDVLTTISSEQRKLLKIIRRSGLKYSLGETYETLISGFEVTIKAGDFDKLNNLLSSYATLMVGEVYNECESVVVENLVDVYDTGIFDSSQCEYQGDGVVVAVLDTGLDYTHTAFNSDEDHFTTSIEKLTLDGISAVIDQTTASTLTSGLTAEDVYVNRKVPFAYDYADKDADVLPIDSAHGTHVAGVIAGKDDTITGVAPNAQLAIMKVFSDTSSGAKTSSLIAALEDCVILGVDVINMSLGSGCGFTREVDEENVNAIYDKVTEQGISLIASAANSYNSTFSSDKNGNNGLTSNPDSGTVGSPSTYEGALSVASVDGVKTPYLVHDGDIIYFNEASTNDADQEKSFVDDILKTVGDVDEYDFTYVTIPGVGKKSDYSQDASYYAGKIVLVKRGDITFEDKVRIALNEMGASGIIIYNNVSGDISMAVGNDMGAVCSISQDEGEKLAASKTGTITVSRNNTAGPFMSDFSSWGPTSDLKIKPEITAHGGEILSAVPGQGYERMSGTSMAAPNQSGATALIRQYVTYSGVFGENLSSKEINSIVNRLMMSTADIITNKNGLPYSVRKQGAGLVNITRATTTASYITTYDTDGNAMDKTKLELGDDKQRTGVYEMTFDITNISTSSASYNIGSIIMTEGVSSTYTGHDETTVTQNGYLLSGTDLTIVSATGGNLNGKTISVAAGETAKVTVKITLSEEDKQYMNDSFENGMYVEGFITLEAESGTDVDMSIPMLAFYGDWTEAPIFDEEYYDTNADELNSGLDENDKIMADAYATRVYGGLYSDYIATLGTYYFEQDPTAVQIAADKDHIAISNQSSESSWTISSIYSINAGLLRNCKEVDIVITEDSTGRVVYSQAEYNQRKSFSSGSSIYASSIDVDFSAYDYGLKNNTQYTVTVTAYIDYGEKSEQNNKRNTFTFPLYIDYEAPAVTGVTYRSVYDKSTKTNRLYADISVYDNHYTMGVQVGQIIEAEEGSGYTFSMDTFGKYITPVYSSMNSTSTVTFELTDYISKLKDSCGIRYLSDGTSQVVYNTNTYVVTCYDYAMNSATYEITLPDDILSMAFVDDTQSTNPTNIDSLSLSPNETKVLSNILSVYPSDTWAELVTYTSSDTDIVDIVNGNLLAKETAGTATVTASITTDDGDTITASIDVTVLSKGDPGYKVYTKPSVSSFSVDGYTTLKAYYSVSSSERDIGVTDGEYKFGTDYTLSMYPSESVQLNCSVASYYDYEIRYTAGNSRIATVSEDGTVVAQKEGSTTITVTVYSNGKATYYSQTISVTVKDPFNITSIYLYNYRGLGGTVEIPSDRGITTIYDYAFSGYEYVEKDTSAGDVIDDEDPYSIKQHYIGDDTITKIIIPEGVTTINQYAFANLTALEEVVLPSTLTKIGVGAFYGCTKLSKINLENVQFINERAFYGCDLSEINLASAVSIGNYAFEDCKLNYIELPSSCQSLAEGAFYNNTSLASVYFAASKMKIGSYAFSGCTALTAVNINATVISSYAFYGCSALESVTLGKDVTVIGEYAFSGTGVKAFKLDSRNTSLTAEDGGAMIMKGDELLLVAPMYGGTQNTITVTASKIATGAFAGNKKVYKVIADNVESISDYAFAGCTNLAEVSLNKVLTIGDYAFAGCTSLKTLPDISNVGYIGNFAFYYTALESVVIPDGCEVDSYAFAVLTALKSVIVGNNVTLGEGAFYMPAVDGSYESTGSISSYYYTSYTYEVKDSDGNVVDSYIYYRYDPSTYSASSLKSVEIGNDVTVGYGAFYGHYLLSDLTFGDNVTIGDYAFYNDSSLTSVDFSGVTSIGNYAFSGSRLYDFWTYSADGENVYTYAYERSYVDGEVVITDYKYSGYAPKIAVLDLSSVTSLGVGAFAYNYALTSVTLNDSLTEIPAYAFAGATSLTEVTLPETVTSIGYYAFYKVGVTTIDLSSVTEVGYYSFARSSLQSVTLNENGSEVLAGAFMYAYDLSAVENLDKVTYIGAYAFAGTLLEEADLASATYIGDLAFASSSLQQVTFGSALVSLGENPFYDCAIETYGKYEPVTFMGNVVGEELVDTYDISDSVFVYDGVLYQLVSNGGLELVSYPASSSVKNYTVEEGTVRLAAYSFASSSLLNVTLPTTLKAIGHKAFYGAVNLTTVTFLSRYAPTLEEEFSTSMYSYLNLPFTGRMGDYEGLGIVDYYMWNVTSKYSNFYYGATFVDYIGNMQDYVITMIYPSNGEYYNTFIMQKYFANSSVGSPAATEATNSVIDLIAALPSSLEVELSSEAVITAARTAYDALSNEQKALVTNYSRLSAAESRLSELKYNDSKDDPGSDEPTTDEVVSFTDSVWFDVMFGCFGILLGGAIAVLIVFIRKRGAAKKSD